ncbi:MAG: hypothetical protein ACF8Q5_01030 [Phycisphaerales bacterium JB040]
MKKTMIACVGALMLAGTANAQLEVVSDDFESYDITGNTIGNGWVVGANVFDEFFLAYLYGYFAFPAGNNRPDTTGTDAFSAIVDDQGGVDQGAQQLSMYSDYSNGDHALGYYIESFMYQEQGITASDAGTIVTFSFDAKVGPILTNTDSLAEARAFIKVLNPATGYSETYSDAITDEAMFTAAGETWNRYFISVEILPEWENQVIQYGFANLCTLYEPSGMYYDNVNLDGPDVPCPADFNGDGVLDNGDIGAFVNAFLAGCSD